MPVEIIHLQECFRCGDRIVEAANRLIAHNGDPLATPMIGCTGRAGTIDVFAGRSAAIAARVQRFHDEQSYAWRDIAVIARSHRVLKRLAAVFLEAGVPHYRVGASFDVCETEEFRAVHAFLRLLVNRDDDLAFLRMYPLLGITDQQYAAIRSVAAEKGVSHGQAMIAWCEGDFENEIQEAIAFQGDPDSDAPVKSAAAWAAFAGVRLQQFFTEPGQTETFSPVTVFWERFCPSMPPAEALDWHATRDQTDDVRTGNQVTLLTGHAAKGLEFPVVIIANCNEGDFPSSQSAKDPNAVAEERRLFYVAETRAREVLSLHYRREEDQAEGRRISPPSRFLSESGVMETVEHGG